MRRSGQGSVKGLVTGMLLLACSIGCGHEEARIPKPRAYPRIHFPDRHYVQFQETECPLTFQYPDYMDVVMQEDDPQGKAHHRCWFDLKAKPLGATLHFSYYPIGAEKDFDALVSDAFKIADRINARANYMDEIRVANAQGVSGLIMEFTGSAASPLHFFLTDSTAHFLKASLYYQSRVEPDSLAPMTDFLRDDIGVMINSLTFR